jgi:hypothetical protein
MRDRDTVVMCHQRFNDSLISAQMTPHTAVHSDAEMWVELRLSTCSNAHIIPPQLVSITVRRSEGTVPLRGLCRPQSLYRSDAFIHSMEQSIKISFPHVPVGQAFKRVHDCIPTLTHKKLWQWAWPCHVTLAGLHALHNSRCHPQIRNSHS